MVLMIISLILWIIILVYNAVYSLLPSNIQGLKWIRALAIVVAIIILVSGIMQEIKKYCNFRFAYISSKDGAILKRKNFPWTVTKSYYEGNIIYSINERYGDATDITLKIPSKKIKYEVYNAMNGVGIKFTCPENEIPDFKIEISQ